MNNQGPIHLKTAQLEKKPSFHSAWKRFNTPRNLAKQMGYAIGKQIPDLLTLLRLVLALVLFGSGLVDGEASPGRDIWLLVIGWTTDMADGRISRSIKKLQTLVGIRLLLPAAFARKYNGITGSTFWLKTQNTSWLGQHDVYVDMLVSVAVLGYLAVTALLPFWLPLAYLLIWCVVFLRWGISDLFAQVFQNPIYAAFVFLTIRSEPAVLPWLLLWAAVALLFFWRRMLQLLKNVWTTIQG